MPDKKHHPLPATNGGSSLGMPQEGMLIDGVSQDVKVKAQLGPNMHTQNTKASWHTYVSGDWFTK